LLVKDNVNHFTKNVPQATELNDMFFLAERNKILIPDRGTMSFWQKTKKASRSEAFSLQKNIIH
jgi:hypothetical protein